MLRRRSKATARAVTWAAIERALELLSCAKILEVLRVRAESRLLLEEVIDPADHKLQVLHPALRHRPRLTKSSDSVGTEIVERV